MLLHIAYRIDIKKWRVSSEEDKTLLSSKKKEVHDRFKAELGLKVDEPKQGAGNTNEGNTARSAITDGEIFADICGLDRYLDCPWTLNPLDSIAWKRLNALCSCTMVQNACECPCSATTRSKSIVCSSMLQIGMMSEEAQEARNKDNKHFREKHTRNTSRVDTMHDVFLRLMVTGDIAICSASLK